MSTGCTRQCPRCDYPVNDPLLVRCPRCRTPISGGCQGRWRGCLPTKKRSKKKSLEI